MLALQHFEFIVLEPGPQGTPGGEASMICSTIGWVFLIANKSVHEGSTESILALKLNDRVSPNRSLSGKEWAHNPTEHESATIGQSKRGINIREWWSEPWAEVDFFCSPTPLGYSTRGKYWRAGQNDIFLKSFSPTSIWIYFQKYLLWGCTTAQIGSKGAW